MWPWCVALVNSGAMHADTESTTRRTVRVSHWSSSSSNVRARRCASVSLLAQKKD